MNTSSSDQRGSLASFPQELLCTICDYLEVIHKPTVPDFALVNHAFHAAATASLFNTIRIGVRGSSQLSKEVDKWVDMLSVKGFRHVRRLVVYGRMRRDPYVYSFDDDDDELHHEDRWNDTNPRRPISPRPSAFHLDENIRLAPDRKSHRMAYKEDESWLHLARVIEKLPKLSDLIYGCANQFPPCLLRALETFQPDCKLHMKTFRLRSLNENQFDAHELALSKSPCLHSISVTYDTHSSFNGNTDYNESAVMELVAGMAPNLKEVSTILVNSGHRGMGQITPWPGFAMEKEERMPQLGSLEVLDLDGHLGRSLEDWLACVDLKILQTFRYHKEMSNDQLSHLETSCHFTSLTTLSMNLMDFSDGGISKTAYTNTLGRFFSTLPSLLSLELVGALDYPTFFLILEMPGTIKRLCLLPNEGFPSQLVLGAKEVDMLNVSFPQLEELVLKVPRSRGNAKEVAIYKALGSMPKLQRLSLTLDATNLAIHFNQWHEPPNDITFDQIDKELFHKSSPVRNGHIRDFFINSASDEVLARSIFQTITHAQPNRKSHLETLRLQFLCNCAYSTTVRSIGVHLGRPWTVESSANQHKPDGLFVTEDERPLEDEDDILGPPTLNGRIEEIFRRLWPAKQRGGDWRQDWKSWALSER